MASAVILFLIPVLLFVIAFLYETYLSFRRINKPKAGKSGYVSATWEVTHTLLVAAVVMLVMMFTSSLDELSSAIFVATFLAAVVLGVRAILYIYIFYVRDHKKKPNYVDWLFAISHVCAAILLVIVVLQALWFLYQNNPPANTQFLPYFIPGIIVIILITLLPIFVIYKTKD